MEYRTSSCRSRILCREAIKLFCEMCNIPIAGKKINRGLPKIRRFADDGAPTIEEIRNICEYPDRRIKGIVSTMASSGIRLGAWDYLRWGHIKPVKKEKRIIALIMEFLSGGIGVTMLSSAQSAEAAFALN